MSRVGSTVFDNLPLLFAIGVAIGMAKKEKEVAALSSVIAYLVMHTSIYALLLLHGKIAEDGQIADLYWKAVLHRSAESHLCRSVCLAELS